MAALRRSPDAAGEHPRRPTPAGANEEMQLGLGTNFGRKVNRPEIIAELSNKGVMRIAAGMQRCTLPSCATSPRCRA